MAISDASICNIALRRIGVTQSISALTDSSLEAQACNSVFLHVRENLLSLAAWPFAQTRATLALLTDNSADPVGGWSYVYALPSDCLYATRVWSGQRVPTQAQRMPFVLEYDSTSRKVLLCDLETTTDDPVTLEYVKNITDPTLFPATFRDALVWALASELAMALSVDDSRAMRAKQAAEFALSRAMAGAYNEQHDVMPDSEIISTRGQSTWTTNRGPF